MVKCKAVVASLLLAIVLLAGCRKSDKVNPGSGTTTIPVSTTTTVPVNSTTLLGSLRVPYGTLIGISLQDTTQYREYYFPAPSAIKGDVLFTPSKELVDWLNQDATPTRWINVFKQTNLDQLWYARTLYKDTYWAEVTGSTAYGLWITLMHKDEVVFKYKNGDSPLYANAPIPERTDLVNIYLVDKATKSFRAIVGKLP